MQSSRTKGIARTIFVYAALTSFFVNDAPAQTPDSVNLAAPTSWTNLDAEHVYGFPDIKAGRKGKLVLTADSFTFTDKSSNSSIARSSILALSNGTEQVEMWGTTGQMVRMVLPDGGVLAGAVLHHRVGMLTVDFVDNRGGMHSAVFDMAPAQSDAAMTMFATIPVPSRAPLEAVSCADAQTNPGSVLVAEPNWEGAQVPAAYRALVYEHVISRLKDVKGISHVYREGEKAVDGTCPAYTVGISVQAFKQGNQIYRSSLGPVGMFVGTTQVSFNFNLTDAAGNVSQKEQLKASIRMQSESITVADKFAKTLAKHYAASLHKEETAPQHTQTTPASSFR